MSHTIQETISRSTEPRNEGTVNPPSGVSLPSESVEPTRTHTPPQQGATQPGSGGEVHDHEQATGQPRVIEVPAAGNKVPFKERVVGAALKTRGTVLQKPELKETGQQLFDGQMDLHEARAIVHPEKQ